MELIMEKPFTKEILYKLALKDWLTPKYRKLLLDYLDSLKE